MNHACDPSCEIHLSSNVSDKTIHKFGEVFTRTKLKPGEELTFFYPSTEWDMDEAFECNCKSQNCLNLIQGAKYLTPAQRKKRFFNQFIKNLFNDEDKPRLSL